MQSILTRARKIKRYREERQGYIITPLKIHWPEHNLTTVIGKVLSRYEGLDGGVSNSLISKNLAHYSLSLKFLLIL